MKQSKVIFGTSVLPTYKEGGGIERRISFISGRKTGREWYLRQQADKALEENKNVVVMRKDSIEEYKENK